MSKYVVTKIEKCEWCDGIGTSLYFDTNKKCENCKGTGKIETIVDFKEALENCGLKELRDELFEIANGMDI